MPRNQNRAPEISVRIARREDAARIGELSAQLGYPVSPGEVIRRMAKLAPSRENIIFVALNHEDKVIGWLHAFVCRFVESGARTEIGGLVVDEDYRRTGAGRKLMQRAEQWARGKHCEAVNLRTNIVRTDAHAFYRSLGYDLVKTQHAFRKKLV